MRYVLWNLAVAFGFCFSLSSLGATASDQFSFEGVDITPLVKYYSNHIMTLTKPVTVYNWAHHGTNPYWDKEVVQGEPSLIKMAKNETHSFWDNYGGQKGAGNMYGYGLYAAADPVVTFSYGGGNVTGGSNDWLLFEMNLPVGFKLVDLGYSSMITQASTPQEVVDLTRKFNCNRIDINSFFVNGGLYVDSHCQKLIKEIFTHDLKMNAFAYEYDSTPFASCGNQANNYGYQFSKAFVITDESWITPKNVKFFTSLSTTDVDSRIRIETLFLQAQEDQYANSSSGSGINDQIENLLMNFPDSAIYGTTTTCTGAMCVLTLHLCDSKSYCVDENVGPLPRKGGGTITQEEAAQSNFARNLLWPDLEGKPKTSSISTWLKDNKYGCSGEPPFKLPPEIAGSHQ